jgi:hypothetical protein
LSGDQIVIGRGMVPLGRMIANFDETTTSAPEQTKQ